MKRRACSYSSRQHPWHRLIAWPSQGVPLTQVRQLNWLFNSAQSPRRPWAPIAHHRGRCEAYSRSIFRRVNRFGYTSANRTKRRLAFVGSFVLFSPSYWRTLMHRKLGILMVLLAAGCSASNAPSDATSGLTGADLTEVTLKVDNMT